MILRRSGNEVQKRLRSFVNLSASNRPRGMNAPSRNGLGSGDEPGSVAPRYPPKNRTDGQAFDSGRVGTLIRDETLGISDFTGMMVEALRVPEFL